MFASEPLAMARGQWLDANGRMANAAADGPMPLPNATGPMPTPMANIENIGFAMVFKENIGFPKADFAMSLNEILCFP